MGSLLTGRQAGRTTAQETEYWDRIAREWPHQARTPLWRQHSDRVNGALLARWLPRRPMGFVLKTDLFEEAVGDGLYPLLPQWARSAIGIDLSHTAVARAMRRHRQLKGLVADVRRLPFKSGSFDSIVSTSTLDHFGRASDIEAAFAELNRVLRPGGELVITMDNARNPVIALRERVQAPLLWLGILPYFTGVSCDAGGLRRLLTEAGFEIRDETTVFHAPRVLAMVVARVLDAFGVSRLNRYYLDLVGGFERLADSRAGRVTGYFVAARAVKR